jgi:hypothetical protein
VYVDRHPLVLGEQVGNENWRDGNFHLHGHSLSQKHINY